jgi:ATP-dependent Lhr-like helicase
MKSGLTNDQLFERALAWFRHFGWEPRDFQRKAWKSAIAQKSGLVNAPTGSGKTYSLLVPALLCSSNLEPKPGKGLRILWITPIRALSREIEQATERLLKAFLPQWRVGVRNGDTGGAERKMQQKSCPEVLISTPESLHLLLAMKGYPKFFESLDFVVVDEWHELLGSKRGVQVELALSRLRSLRPKLQTWGITATIGNLEEGQYVLHGADGFADAVLIRSKEAKPIEVHTVLPDEVETFPWGGHLGVRLLEKVLPIIEQSNTCLVFTNTRAQSEIWYQRLLEVAPDLAGRMAMHHGSVSRELRHWVEDALHEGKLKLVVCTGSLDLGVDFRPVDTVIQVGGPKGVSRFIQRAGRSGHSPGAVSRIYFVPTHSLEILEGAALREAISAQAHERRIPYIRSFDVLIQYLVTLAVSEGFEPRQTMREVQGTASFESMSLEEYDQVLDFIVTGGPGLHAYDEYHKVVVKEGKYVVESRRVAMRHRLSIGTITSDQMLPVVYVGGGKIGHAEEWFVSKLKAGDVFWLAGKPLEFVRMRDMQVQVRRSTSTKGLVPSWQGGRMPLSSQLGSLLRQQLSATNALHPEIQALKPLFSVQKQRSVIPGPNQFLMEKVHTKEGWHLFLFPFEGRFVHEGMASLLAWRIGRHKNISFSIAMNDYGLELLSDQELPWEALEAWQVFDTRHLLQDIQASINDTEMAGRKFRDIARVSGLVFQGYPGKTKADKHLQSSSKLFFEVFREQAPHHVLLRQAYEEVYEFQLEQERLKSALERIQSQEKCQITLEKPSPFAFPIMVERIRERFSNESLEERVRKMVVTFQ